MTDKYATFKAEDFVQDDFFITSAINPAEISDEFWDRLRYANAIDCDEEAVARRIIDSVQVEREKMPEDEQFELWNRIERSNKVFLNRKVRHLRRLVYSISGIAAAVLLMMILWKSLIPEPSMETVTMISEIENVIPPATKTTDIQLVLGDNKTVILEGDESSITYGGDKIVIENSRNGEKKEEIETEAAFNQLIVPLGKRAGLMLSDSTRLMVNAGSRVVYPAVFADAKREIYIDGEAYIEVAKDAARPFIVKTDRLTLEALGTAFDVNTYRKDSIHYIALVEGSVRISRKDGSKTILNPNELYTCDGATFDVRAVNTDDYISWKDGVLQYDSEPLGNIVLRLSRYYGYTIECSREASELRCTGTLDLKDELQKVLEGIALTAPVKVAFSENKYMITNHLK